MLKARVSPRTDEGRLHCPYCRGLIDQEARPCLGCGATLHRDCWLELGRCPTMGCRVVAVDRLNGQTAESPEAVSEEPLPLLRITILGFAVIVPILIGVALRLDLDGLLRIAPKEALILVVIAFYFGLFKLLRRWEDRAPRTIDASASSDQAGPGASAKLLTAARTGAVWIFAAAAPAAVLAALLSQESLAARLPPEQVFGALLGYWALLGAVAYSKWQER